MGHNPNRRFRQHPFLFSGTGTGCLRHFLLLIFSHYGAGLRAACSIKLDRQSLRFELAAMVNVVTFASSAL